MGANMCGGARDGAQPAQPTIKGEAVEGDAAGAVGPGAQDMTDAKLLYVKLKCKWDSGAEGAPTKIDDLRAGLGDGGLTKPWSGMDGLRHKYFVYNEETDTVSGVYGEYKLCAQPAKPMAGFVWRVMPPPHPLAGCKFCHFNVRPWVGITMEPGSASGTWARIDTPVAQSLWPCGVAYICNTLTRPHALPGFTSSPPSSLPPLHSSPARPSPSLLLPGEA